MRKTILFILLFLLNYSSLSGDDRFDVIEEINETGFFEVLESSFISDHKINQFIKEFDPLRPKDSKISSQLLQVLHYYYSDRFSVSQNVLSQIDINELENQSSEVKNLYVLANVLIELRERKDYNKNKAALNSILDDANGNKRFVAHVHHALIKLAARFRKFDEARSRVEITLQYCEDHALQFERGMIFYAAGLIEYDQSKPKEALKYLEEANKIFSAKNTKVHKARVINSKAIIFRIKGLHKESLSNYYHALDIYEKLEMKEKSGLIYNNLGLLYKDKSDYKKSLLMFDKAEQAFNAQYNERYMSYLYTNRGDVLNLMKRYEESEDYLQKGIDLKIKINESTALIHSYNLLGELKFNQAKLQEAEELFLQAKELSHETNYKRYLSQSLYGLGLIAEARKQNKKAIDRTYEALEIARETHDFDDELKCLQFISKLYKQHGDYEHSYNYLILAQAVRDSLLGQKKIQEFDKLNFEYENKKMQLEQQLQIAKLKTQNIHKDTVISNNRQRFAFSILMLFLSFLSLGLVYKLFLEKKGSNEKLTKVNELLQSSNKKLETNQEILRETNAHLSNFAGVAAHDLKGPLRTMSAFSSILSKKYKDKISEKDQEYFDLINRSSSQLTKMIDDLLIFTRIDQELPNSESISLDNIVTSITDLLAKQIKDKEAIIEYENLGTVVGHETMIKVLLQNLIQNSLKFTVPYKKPHIVIKSEATTENELMITVTDNGLGIPSGKLGQIFEGFKKLHNSDTYEGTGIGLATCKKIVNHYDGKIWAKSELGEGTSIYFTLPSFSV